MKTMVSKVLAFLLPGFGDILWIAVFAGVIGLGPRMMNIDGDLGRHLTIGSYILQQGQVPVHDVFSHTMTGQALTPHEWLAQVLFALAYTLLGLDGVVLLCGLVIATAFWLVFRRSRATSHVLLASVAAVVLAVAAASLHWLSRPHIFTFLMLVLWIDVLEAMRRGRVGRWWLLPVLMLAWANLHGAFIAGFVTWALYGAGLAWDLLWRRLPKAEGLHGRFWRYFFLGGAGSLLVTLLNPAGLELWSTSTGYIGNRYLVGHTAEYLPPNFHDPSTWPFLLMIGLLVVVLGLQSRRVEGAHVLASSGWLVMALYSTRNIPLFAIVAAPLLAQALGGWLADYHHRLRLLDRIAALDKRLLATDLHLRSIVWPASVLLITALLLRSGADLDFQQRGNIFDPQVFPVRAADWIEANPPEGEMFNYFPWGGYLLYRLWPEQRVFIDGQTDFYGEELTRAYERVLTAAPGWETVIEQYGVDWAILPRYDQLAGVLKNQSGWTVQYEDDTAVVLRKAP